MNFSEVQVSLGSSQSIMTTKSIADFKTGSKSLKEIDGKKFTIVKVEESAYDGTPGVRITTEEKFQVGDTLDNCNTFHTTRTAIVRQLLSDTILAALNGGTKITAKCVPKKSKNGKDYFALVEAD